MFGLPLELITMIVSYIASAYIRLQADKRQDLADERLASLLEQMQENLASNHTIDTLAEQMHMSRRTFTRHFQSLTGQSVGQWLLNQRLNHAQRLLESTDLPLEHLAEQCGFGSSVTLRHHFRSQFGLSPRDWRNAFRQA